MISGLFIGTSGWSYPDEWSGVFYHKSSTLLQQYLTYFNTAEINSTFYALPRPNFIKHLSSAITEDKFFTAKIPKAVTHDNRLDISGEGGVVLEKYFELMHPMIDKIKALLIQLPPWPLNKMNDFETFLSSLDPSFRYAAEFRDESWLIPKVWSFLEKYNIAHVIVDEPKLPIDLRVTSDFAYIRWHGHGKKPWFYYRYSPEELEPWVSRIESIQDETKTILGYFNNHFQAYSPLNAFQMLQLLGKANQKQLMKLERMLESFSTAQTSLSDF
jgi:uncharacterized protein YecE (DUF72 family)